MSAPTSKITGLEDILNHPLFREGLEAYREESFFEAHEIWEDLWRQVDGVHRDGVRALIQIAAGFVKLRNGEWIGARALWRRAVANSTLLCRDAPAFAPVFAEAARLATLADQRSLPPDFPPVNIPDTPVLLQSIHLSRDRQ